VPANLFTFGSPRVGNEGFGAWAGTILDLERSSRVTREGDIVPRLVPQLLPLKQGVEHFNHVHTRELWNRHNGSVSNSVAGEVNWLVDCDVESLASGEDPACADSTPPKDLYDRSAEGCGQHCNYLGMKGGGCGE